MGVYSLILRMNGDPFGRDFQIANVTGRIDEQKAADGRALDLPRPFDRLLGIVRPYLPEGEPMYDPEALTDRSERFLAAEIVREKVFRWTGDELPYSSTVIVDKFETEGRLRRVFVTILVDRDAHKAMIIGAKGAKLKQISTEARMDMEKLFDGKVYLEVWIKVKSGWADNEAGLRAYGYE